MELNFRKRITYIIYTKPYSYIGITRAKLASEMAEYKQLKAKFES